MQRMHSQQKIMITVLSVALGAAAIMIWILIQRLTGSMQNMVSVMQKAGKGELRARVEIEEDMSGEMETIALEFNHMLERLSRSLENEREANTRQREAEIAALEAQINPHFLYNLLDTINWMAIDREEYEISNSISALAFILRYGIDNSNGIVSVREECEWLKKYLFLQQTRLKYAFQCEMHIEPEIMECKIHKLLLQPFVENGKAGYELVRKAKPDLVITDIKMPEMDGLEMLSCLYEEGNMPKTIVLSAYSEFEYARKAMRLGIKEYLLKPIVIGDLSAALHRVEEEIYQESRKQESFANVQQVFAGILWNTLEVNEPLKKWLFDNYHITGETSYHVICLYLGENFERKKESGKRDLERLLSGRKKWNYVMLEAQREKGVLLLVYDCVDVQELERWVQYQLLGNPNLISGSAVGFVPNVSLEELKKAMETLLEHMDWNISLGKDVVISYPKVTRLQTSPCIYPLEQENQMKQAICTGEKEKICKKTEEFCAYFKRGKLYAPREIKECYVRFLWAFMNTAKEVGMLSHTGLEQQKLLEQIMGAKTPEELEAAIKNLLENIEQRVFK